MMSAQQLSTIVDSENVAWLRDYTIKAVGGEEFEIKMLSSYTVTNGRIKSFFLRPNLLKHGIANPVQQ